MTQVATMLPARLLVLFLLLTTSAACSGPESLAQQPSLSLPAVSQQSQAAPKSQLKNGVRTEPLIPTPIRITPNDLPQPYASDSASKSPSVVSVPENPVLRVPPGFTVSVFAEGLDEPRWLALTPEGDVLVTETYQNRIRLLRDSDGDGVADVRRTFADPGNGVNQPLGMAFTNGSFFLANTDAVLRFPYTNEHEQLTGNGQKITDLPGGGYNQHWTRNLVVSPDRQKLYVSVGSKSNASEEPLPRASVQIMNLDGSNRQTFASGLRNPVGLDFHPVTGELYTAVNERDRLGDDLVPDYLTRIRQGDSTAGPTPTCPPIASTHAMLKMDGAIAPTWQPRPGPPRSCSRPTLLP